MKKISFKMTWFSLCTLIAFINFTACVNNSDDEKETESGNLTLEFSHFVGTDELSLSDSSSIEYPYKTENDQSFNINKFGYYITQIKLSGPDLSFEDKVKSSIKADEVKGFYQILESEPKSKDISLTGITPGKYTEIEFTVGIPEETVTEGAQGGILDLAKGAWFWGWNSGYISMVIEGKSPESTAKDDEGEINNNLAFHIGGWKDIVPPSGEMQKMVNNIKTLKMTLPDPINISTDVTPQIHIVVDILKLIDAANFDFSKINSLHNPAMGTTMAEAFSKAFLVDHVHAH